ncbi:addiction module antidote protein, HigA family [Paludibacter sp. 221]|uniref:HigA family addiction module antitoxin n=1 Tax=Paludibacter sp. 221 TaxID=2302939 RepID=UPI0013D64E74|nr:HigA family addiction module antitoxin [Paludibacter sp. 221]NDV47802.1 addiction module antidote protein, HigA family [Paludibacter sp. 221]
MKTANKLTPYTPTHPGEVIKDEIEYRGISQKDLSEKISISYTMLNEVLNGKRPVTANFAILIEAALGIEADILVNMQARYNIQVARKDENILSKARKVAAIL